MNHLRKFKTISEAAYLIMKSPALKMVNGKFEVMNVGNKIEIKINAVGNFILPYLCFTADGEDSIISLRNNGGNAPVIYYSFDNKEWTRWNYDLISLINGQSIYMYGDNPSGFSRDDEEEYSLFIMTGKIAVSGNILSLISKDMPSEIPCDYCYTYMFNNCASLTQAPELPATTLAEYCYLDMFNGCTSLTQAPELPATTLENNCYSGMFYNCTSLTQAPELPATTLDAYCYYRMFYSCTSLTRAPELPATTLAINCYSGMFLRCAKLSEVTIYATSWNTSYASSWLTGVSALGTFYNLGNADIPSGISGTPSGWNVILPYLCFTADGEDSTISLFDDGGNAPVIYYSFDAIEWSSWNYDYDLISLVNGQSVYMYGDNPTGFSYSTPRRYSRFVMTGKIAASGNILSLISKDIPSEIPCDKYYYNMFNNCASLTQAPKLPATTLAEYCYYNMFIYCTSLTQAPELPATNLVSNCYLYMFFGCTKLSEVTTYAKSWNTSYALSWLTGVSALGTFYNLGNADIPSGPDGIPSEWNVMSYLCFAADGEDSTISLSNNGGNAPIIYYSFDAKEWTRWNYDLISLVNGQSVYMYGNNPSGFSHDDEEEYSLFIMTGKIAASGNILSLISKDMPSEIPCDYCYSLMFYGCTSLSQAPELPATTLASSCYSSMFYECTSLTTAPELPATILAGSCYSSMFLRCTSLTQAPELPATILAGSCYGYMFRDCASLTQAPELPATTLDVYCYYNMFLSCTSLSQAPELPATTLAKFCYLGMFDGCTSLTQAPELSSTTLADHCYSNMFDGCTSLSQAPELPATTLAFGCYSSMFYECTSLTTAPELPATILASSCYSHMFFKCKSLTQAPELPATTLAFGCYQYVFYGCTSLTTAPELPATTLADYCYYNMFYGCTKLSEVTTYAKSWNSSVTFAWLSGVSTSGTFYNLGNANIPSGSSGIPSGWTVLTSK